MERAKAGLTGPAQAHVRTLSRMSLLALAASKSLTTSACPRSQACMRGVLPACVHDKHTCAHGLRMHVMKAQVGAWAQV